MGFAVVLAFGLVATAQAQTAPMVTDVTVELGQGHAVFHGKPKFRARGAVAFKVNGDGVRCTDKIALERRVRRVVDRRFEFLWIEIAKGDQRERTCADRPAAPKPAAQRSAVSLFHGDTDYRRLVRAGPMRIRYEITITVGGQSAFHRSVSQAVTLRSLSQAYASQPV
jgi:hypothetical protein